MEVTAELTNACNLHCRMCPQDQTVRPRGFMKEETFQKIVDQSVGATELFYLHMGGESLLHPQVGEFVGYAKQRGLYTSISTNGVPLTEEVSRELVAGNLDWLIVSIDAACAETFQKIKGVNAYERVIENVLRFLEMRSDNRRPYVTVQMVVSETNENEASEFWRFWGSRKVNSVRLKPMANFGGLVGEESEPRDRPCFLLWRQIAFTWKGHAALCCFDIVDPKNLGCIEEATLEEIWNGKGFRGWRKRHRLLKFAERDLCYRCTVASPSIIPVIGATLLPGAALKRTLAWFERIPVLRWNR